MPVLALSDSITELVHAFVEDIQQVMTDHQLTTATKVLSIPALLTALQKKYPHLEIDHREAAVAFAQSGSCWNSELLDSFRGKDDVTDLLTDWVWKFGKINGIKYLSVPEIYEQMKQLVGEHCAFSEYTLNSRLRMGYLDENFEILRFKHSSNGHLRYQIQLKPKPPEDSNGGALHGWRVRISVCACSTNS